MPLNELHSPRMRSKARNVCGAFTMFKYRSNQRLLLSSPLSWFRLVTRYKSKKIENRRKTSMFLARTGSVREVKELGKAERENGTLH